MPPDQKAFQIESIWLRISPVSMSYPCYLFRRKAVSEARAATIPQDLVEKNFPDFLVGANSFALGD